MRKSQNNQNNPQSTQRYQHNSQQYQTYQINCSSYQQGYSDFIAVIDNNDFPVA